MTIIIFIIILAILVLSHEFGHFIVAKATKMRVDEFGFGFPPKIASFKYGETVYSINAIPFGGFVKIYGEDGGDGEGSFSKKGKIAQAATLSAGVLFNILLAWLLLSIGFYIGFPTAISDENRDVLENPRVFITNVVEGGPAEISGIELGDIVTKISAGDDEIMPIFYEDAILFVENNIDHEISIYYERGGEEYVASMISSKGIIEERNAIGVSFDTIGIMSEPLFSSIVGGLKSTWFILVETVRGFYNFIVNSISGRESLSSISGPVGIYGIVDDASSLGLPYVIGITAIISISLAIINLIPFPALDGGRLLFLFIEAIRGKEMNPKVTKALNVIGFGALILLMLVVSYSDLVKIGIF